MAKQLLAACLVFLWLASAAFAQERSTSRSYRIGPRDLIQIQVDEIPDLDGEHEVADDGTLTLAIVGTVVVQGLTESELAARLRSRLEAEGMRRATVTTTVSAFRSRPVSVLGAVGEPGNHYVPGRATLLEVLMSVGGLANGHGGEIVVRRQADNGLSDQVRISVAQLIEVGEPTVNIPIFAGDLINVPPAREVVIHFLGEVNNPGSLTFTSDQPVTLLTAIARAGGLTETASKKIRVQRRTADGGRREIVVDYRRVLSSRDPDLELESGDLVVVKESFF